MIHRKKEVKKVKNINFFFIREGKTKFLIIAFE